MNSYLYVLPFADNQHFKIGISERIDSRIGKHNSQYNLKVSDIKLIKSNAHNIKLLERLLLTVCPPLKDNSFSGIDGATEIVKVNPDNTISIRFKEEKMYSRSEVVELCSKAFSAGEAYRTGSCEGFKQIHLDKHDWLKENLK